jgi:hypothetical protein
VDGSFRGARWAWTWKPEGSRFPSSLLEWWSQLRPRQRWGKGRGVGETLLQRGLGVCICGAAAYRVLVQWCCVGPCLFGPGRVGLGPCCSIGFSFSPNGALEFVLFCGRLAVSQYNFLFIHSYEEGASNNNCQPTHAQGPPINTAQTTTSSGTGQPASTSTRLGFVATRQSSQSSHVEPEATIEWPRPGPWS